MSIHNNFREIQKVCPFEIFFNVKREEMLAELFTAIRRGFLNESKHNLVVF